MELEWFDWKEWEGDSECVTFYDVTLLKQIGEHSPGTKFHSASIMFLECVLELYASSENDIPEKYRLGYVVGEKL